MNVWLSIHGALTVMDLVTRGWARQLGIDECGVLVLMRLGCKASYSASRLALLCGRARQQVQRSLKLLENAQLVRSETISEAGCTMSWTLTEKGQRRWRALERATRAWEEMLEHVIDLRQLNEMLVRVVETAVNRPAADGWRNGLIEPHDLRKVPLWYQLSIEDDEVEAEEPAPLPHDKERARKEREAERARKQWEAMWRRISG